MKTVTSSCTVLACYFKPMKNKIQAATLLAVLLVFCAESVLAENIKTFKGAAQWTRAEGRWSELEKLGVRKSAEDDAVLACTNAGYRDCVAIDSKIVRCESNLLFGGVCTAIAEAQGIGR